MDEFIVMFLQFSPFLILLGLGYFIGRWREKKHEADLAAREAAMKRAITTNLKRLPDRPVERSFLVTGSVVIASDYYKTIGAKLKTLVGGRLKTLETLVDRSRREAIMRMREEAASQNADIILNVRIETSTIARGQKKSSMPSVEIIAYGTALVLSR